MHVVPNLQALEVYLQSLSPAPSLRHAREQANVLLHNEGRCIFELRNCHRCHPPPYYTSELTYEVGLSDEWQQSEFNPPSLRGLSQRTSFFHDGRAKTLTEIFYKFNRADSNDLSASDFQALLEFLSTLQGCNKMVCHRRQVKARIPTPILTRRDINKLCRPTIN